MTTSTGTATFPSIQVTAETAGIWKLSASYPGVTAPVRHSAAQTAVQSLSLGTHIDVSPDHADRGSTVTITVTGYGFAPNSVLTASIPNNGTFLPADTAAAPTTPSTSKTKYTTNASGQVPAGATYTISTNGSADKTYTSFQLTDASGNVGGGNATRIQYNKP